MCKTLCDRLYYRALCLGLIVFGVLADQASKYYALKNLVFGVPEALAANFNLNLNYNKGVAFGLLNQYESLVQMGLIAMVLLITLGMAFWLWQTPKEDKWQACSLSLIIGGALGNVIDRIYLGHVVDFIDFYVGTWHWPTFNIADSFVCVGAFMLALSTVRLKNITNTQSG